jgi:putative restriction endonuclease
MRDRIGFYRREEIDRRLDYEIGCRILEQPVFFLEKDWIPVPASWSRNIVSGRRYDTGGEDGRRLWTAITEHMPVESSRGFSESRYGEPTLIYPRLGQGTFRVAVTDFYERQCAVTRERTLPILDAAHIRPFAAGGPNEVSNGLLLRTDVHRLFDLGYVTVSDDGRFEVGRRLREEFENGRDYYSMHGRSIFRPTDSRYRPEKEALHWHQTNRFLG